MCAAVGLPAGTRKCNFKFDIDFIIFTYEWKQYKTIQLSKTAETQNCNFMFENRNYSINEGFKQIWEYNMQFRTPLFSIIQIVVQVYLYK